MLLDDQTDQLEPTPNAEPADVRSALLDAFAADEAGDGGAATQAQPDAQQQAQADRTRDQAGRFARANADTQQQAAPGAQQAQPNTPQQAGQQQAQTAPIAAPASWSPAAKAKFAGLDPEVQQAIVARERDVETGMSQWQGQGERLNRLDAVLSPLREHLHVNGVDEATFVSRLVAANNWLDRDPVTAILELGRQKGVSWQNLFQRLQSGATSPQQAVSPNPSVAGGQVDGQVSARLQALEQANAQARLAPIQENIHTFASDPANTYFWNVRDRMVALLRSRQATDLADAYQQACWSDPQVRPLVMQAQAGQQQAQAEQERKAKLQRAQAASGSLNGAPTPGASAASRSQASTSVRSALAEAWDSAV